MFSIFCVLEELGIPMAVDMPFDASKSSVICNAFLHTGYMLRTVRVSASIKHFHVSNPDIL